MFAPSTGSAEESGFAVFCCCLTPPNLIFWHNAAMAEDVIYVDNNTFEHNLTWQDCFKGCIKGAFRLCKYGGRSSDNNETVCELYTTSRFS